LKYEKTDRQIKILNILNMEREELPLEKPKKSKGFFVCSTKP